MGQLKLYGEDLFGNKMIAPFAGKLAEEFIVPPFSVISSLGGFWQKRKRKWKSMGLKSEIGRGTSKKTYSAAGEIMFDNGSSIFDPVLCEVIYRWFCPSNGQIVDPFAGGSVRGIVASLLGFKYWGCDLYKKQIEANIKQASVICERQPIWVHGDADEEVLKAPFADFLFSCPPYGSLEVYTNHANDLSNMSHDDFLPAYEEIIKKACTKLNNNRFACFVVGDFRCKKGFLRNFVSDTITFFKNQGLEFYNESVFLTSIGSAAPRAKRQFNPVRKLVKVHQNVLVFVKGSPKKATENILKA